MSYDSEVLADSPLLYLKCDETAGTVAADSSGNGRDFTVNGSVTLGAAPVLPSGSSSFSFPGLATAFLNRLNEAWMAQPSFTVEAWVNAASWSANPSIWSTDGKLSTRRGPTFGAQSTSGKVLLNPGTNVGASTHVTGTSYYFAVTYDSTTQTISFYVNGAADGTATASITNATLYDMIVGASYYASGSLSAPWNGRMSHVAYYGSVLSAARIAAHYAARTSTSSSVTAVPATAAASTPTPVVTATMPNATVAVPAATATAAALPPNLGATFDAAVAPPAATAIAASHAPSVADGSGNTTIAPLPATATAQAPPPVPTLGFGTDTVNRLNGLSLGGTALVTVEPAIVAPPNTLSVNFGVDKAVALPDPMLDNGRPTNPAYIGARATSKPGSRDRIVVGGVDITYFRGKALRVPGYTLSEPLAYDASSLTVPHVRFDETLGVGDLRWARKGARVTFQRVFADGSKVTDYRGRVLSLRPTGNGLELGIGGQVSGPAGLINEQPPAYWHTKDLGWWAFDATRPFLHMTPRFGPDTGHRIPKTGGITRLAWIQQICAESQEGNNQRSIMPTTWGGNEWTFDFKDTTTVDCTIFLDGARAVADLVDDVAEQPNTWYGTGTTPDGVRIRNIRWPGLMAGDPAPYPIAGNASFGTGTANTDTIDGSGITVLQVKLQWAGYVDQDDYTHGTYDDATAKAVKRLQRDVGLPVTGTVDTKTWNRLFNVDATGWDLTAGRVFPLVQDPAVPDWLYTSNGSIAGANPDHVPGTLEVDRNVDFGGGATKTRMTDYFEGQMERLSGKNWTGTITLNGTGVFFGGWQRGDTPPASAVMSYRDVRPGMNAWLPGFDGGTLVHIGGVSFDGDQSVTLYVDTLARDLMELSEVIKRNRESRRNIRREWRIDNRAGKPAHDLITYDEYGGTVDHDIHLIGNRWNFVAVPMGQTGTVGRTGILLSNPAAEFAFTVLSHDVGHSQLHRRVGNPLVVNDKNETVWETGRVQDWFDNKTILFAAGTSKQPCGYGHRRKFGTDDQGNQVRTDAPLTGRYRSDASWGYVTLSNNRPVVLLAIWPDRDTVLQAGRLFYKLEDDAV